MDVSRRDLLRLGSAAVFSSLALPIANVGSLAHAAARRLAPARRKVEVHFTGKHLYADFIEKAVDKGWSSLPIGELIGKLAYSFLDTPYVSHTLDHSADHEFCIVNLQELDCVTFVESVLALARVIKMGESSDSALASQIELIRYRGGLCNGFCSRLHYLTDWLHDNEKKGLLEVCTPSLPGSKAYVKQVSLMTSRPQEYLQLRKHPEWVPALRKDEKAINSRKEFYLPKNKVRSAEPYMKTGDIVAITTAAKILDCAHTGFCYRDSKGVLRFLHASLDHHKVYLDQELSAYLDTIHAFTGIMLARPREV